MLPEIPPEIPKLIDVTVPLPQPVKHALHRFLELLDSETVRLFVWPFYLGLLCWGIYGTFFSAPAQIVYPVMGDTLYDVWVWLHIPGPAAALIGLILRHGGTPLAEMTETMLLRDYMGLWMQLGGHLCVFLALLWFEVSAVQATDWGQSAFTIFAIGPYVLGALFLAVQTGRKLWAGEALHQATKRRRRR